MYSSWNMDRFMSEKAMVITLPLGARISFVKDVQSEFK